MKQERPNQHIGYFPAAEPTNAEPKPEPVHRPASKRRKPHYINPIRLAALIVCACVFLTCLFLLVRYFYNIAISRRASSQLGQVYTAAVEQKQPAEEAIVEPDSTAAPEVTDEPEPAATSAPMTASYANVETDNVSAEELWPTVYPGNRSLRVSSVFYQLQQQNKDIIGWLKIDGVLEEAVVQRDNEYYLTHNALNQRSVTGALFLDETCDLTSVPTQMLIHGHNMKEGAMFGSLKKYKVKDASYYREHPFIEFNTIYENGRYVIFAVAEVDIRSGKPDYLPFWHDTRFSSTDAFNEYVLKARSLSHYRCNVEVVPGDRLLTLSTCTGTDDNKRLIVMARKIRDGESELELNMDIYSTSDR